MVGFAPSRNGPKAYFPADDDNDDDDDDDSIHIYSTWTVLSSIHELISK
jgi:hypothetical protein